MGELISIIVPVYNVSKFLGECIDSILHQTYKRIEIIMVDDGSNDGSEYICDEYEKKDNRVKVIHQKNLGLSVARNVGVQNALGNYILFVDSDDVIHLQMVEILYFALKNNDADISFCSYSEVEEEIKRSHLIIGKNTNYEIYTGCEVLKRMYKSQYSIESVVAWNKLYKKDFLLEEPYPEGRKHEDEFITYKIVFPLKKCVFVPEKLYFYRQRQGSIINQKFNLNSLDKIFALEERKCFFYKKGEQELYLLTLKRYQTALAEGILNIIKYCPENQEIAMELNKKFRKCWKEEVKNSSLKLEDKIKFVIFLLNKKVYKLLKVTYVSRSKGIEQCNR